MAEENGDGERGGAEKVEQEEEEENKEGEVVEVVTEEEKAK